MSDPLQVLLTQHLPKDSELASEAVGQRDSDTRYLSRLLSLRLSDLNTTEPESLTQAAHSNHVSIQALSSRSHKASTTASDHLVTLKDSLPELSKCVQEIRDAVPQLDKSAVNFATSYSRTREDHAALNHRKDAMLLYRQADRLQDILELPSLLSTTIASAASGSGGANYTQALDLLAHIKRLQILYPDSKLIRSVVDDSQQAMKDMAASLIHSLRGHNIRLASAIRTIGWLRRVVPELRHASSSAPKAISAISQPLPQQQQDDGYFGALFLACRLYTFLTTIDALSPLRDLADQETQRRVDGVQPRIETGRPEPTRRPSTHITNGQQTERYLKRYIEVFREQSFSTISMYRQVFAPEISPSTTDKQEQGSREDPLQLPSAMSTFPLHLVELFTETLRTYLPNVADPVARESLLMQVLYAANSLGRLGGDFSLMIALLEVETAGIPEPGSRIESANGTIDEKVDLSGQTQDEANTMMEEPEPTDDSVPAADQQADTAETQVEPEWARIIRKHRVQAARLEAMAVGQDMGSSRRTSYDVSVR